MPRARAASTISSPSGRCAPAPARRCRWTQVETGSAITWKYPSCILKGEDSVGEFYSVALTNNRQQADTGTKMIHIGANSRSTIVSKGISAGRSNNTYRGLVRVNAGAENVRNFTQCDSACCSATNAAPTPCPISRSATRPPRSSMRRRPRRSATTSSSTRCSAASSPEDAVALIVNGFAREVLQQLPMEFAVEAQKLLGISLEGSVG